MEPLDKICRQIFLKLERLEGFYPQKELADSSFPGSSDF